MAQAIMTGARLTYVVRELEGEVSRAVVKWDKKTGMQTKMVKKTAGYIVYFPQGHVLRLTEEKLRHYNLDKPAQIINMDGIHSPTSPLGQLFRAQNDKQRQGAMERLEDQVIALATRRTGPVILPEQLGVAEPAQAAA